MPHAATAYRRVSERLAAPRDIEIGAFRRVTSMIESATNERARVEALGRNHQLWSLLVRDLSLDENALPADLKTRLIELGSWAMRYSTLAVLHPLDLSPLVEVNRTISAGLAAQAQDSAPQCLTRAQGIQGAALQA